MATNTSDTDSEDEDYIPEGDNVSSEGDDVQTGSEKLQREQKDDDTCKSQVKFTKRKNITSTRRRKGGICLEGEKAGEENSEENEGEREDEDDKEGDKKKKTHIDQLWVEFKSNSSGNFVKGKDSSVAKETNSSKEDTNTEDKEPCSTEESEKTVTIKKSYDFAGEEVVVEEKVSAKSKEAKEYLKSQQTSNEQTKKVFPSFTKSTIKRPGGAQSLLDSLSKKPKMSTLEKSRLDWTKYKKEEGLEEELEFHSKDGYLEKQAFLQRTELRQFEQERDERLKRFKRLY